MFILPLDFDGYCELVLTAITQLNITEKDRIIQKIDLKNKRFVENVKKKTTSGVIGESKREIDRKVSRVMNLTWREK